jgi:hypothetical protein
MSGKSRKKVFPKQPVKFHSKLEKDLGKWSNKVGFEATKKAIYHQLAKPEPKLDDRQTKQLEKLKANLARRTLCQTTM